MSWVVYREKCQYMAFACSEMYKVYKPITSFQLTNQPCVTNN